MSVMDQQYGDIEHIIIDGNFAFKLTIEKTKEMNTIGIDKKKAAELSQKLNDLLANYQVFYTFLLKNKLIQIIINF